MARLSNNEISKMSINSAVEYSREHPAEAGRISKVLSKSALETGKISVLYYTKNTFSINPQKVTIDLQ